MPSLMPLLSSASSTVSVPPVSSKKVSKKLRRKNPPPSLSTNHQKLPSSAGSSTYSLPKSRPSSSKSGHNDHQGWFASPPTPHPGPSGRRKSEPHIGDWSPEDFPLRPPPLPTLGNGMMTPPKSGSPDLMHRNSQGSQVQNHSPSRSVSSVYSSPPASSKQDHFPIVQQTIIHSPPPQIIRGKGRDAFKAFSYDSYNNMPVSPPPQSPPPNSIPPTYLGTAQYPNNLLSQPSTPRQTPRAQTLPTPLITNLAPPTPAQQLLIGRTPNGSPILPPLPSFQSGGFGFDLPDTNDRFAQPKSSPTYPGRQRYKPVGVPPLPSPDAPPLPQRRRPTVFIEPETESPTLESPMLESPLVTSPGDYIFHALTAEEPIILPSSAEQTPEPSPPSSSAEFSQPSAKGRARRKSDAVSSFLGGWKLAMMGGGNSSSTISNDKAINSSSESDVSPVGVGDGGGWIHRRKGSFSSTRPPSRERSKHSAYAQEYKEFRAQKATENVSSSRSSKSSSKRSSAASRDGSIPPISPVEGTGVSAILGNLSTRERFGEKVKAAESRQIKRESEKDAAAIPPPVPVMDPSKIAPSEVVSLDVAVRQMNLLEDQLKKGRPLSPPDSRDGEKSESDKGYRASSEYSQTNTAPSTAQSSRQNSADSSAQSSGTSSPAGSINQKFQLLPAPRPSLAKQKTTESMGKGKSRSPLRNEIDSESVSSGAEGTDDKKKRERSKSSSRHSAISAKQPPSECLGRPKSSGAGLESGAASRPSTPPKPVAKLFVICCRCKYWHDLPSVMYRGMVENGGATRCPYCLHGMEVSCCAGYTCVVYMHQKHH